MTEPRVEERRYLTDLDNLVVKSTEDLLQSYLYWRSKIDGPENDGRLSTGSSAQLDFWADNAHAIGETLRARGVFDLDKKP